MSKARRESKKRPGPKPELLSLYPLKLEEAVRILGKPKLKKKTAAEESESIMKKE